MPIYEYVCADCGKAFEKLMRFSDPNIDHPDCPECESDKTHKRLSTFASFGSAGSNASGDSSCGGSGAFR
jgi:putative FmdB family regulatory protein